MEVLSQELSFYANIWNTENSKSVSHPDSTTNVLIHQVSFRVPVRRGNIIITEWFHFPASTSSRGYWVTKDKAKFANRLAAFRVSSFGHLILSFRLSSLSNHLWRLSFSYSELPPQQHRKAIKQCYYMTNRPVALFTFIYLSFFSSILNIFNAFWLLGNILHCAGEWVNFVVWFIFSISISWSSSWIKTSFRDQTHLWSSSFWNHWLLICSPARLGSVTNSQTSLWASA